ncbi:hypothetical protein B0H34DRAFT_618970, partial [Crassisporium funariophilum]
SLLGQTGVGKSTFINTAAGRTLAEVCEGLTSPELNVQHFIVQHPQDSTRSFVFVDTPGFDHLFASDEQILRIISEWMDKMCHPNACFGGIIYLHDINQIMNRSRIGTLALVELSCPEPANHILMTTVEWGRVRDTRAEHHEQGLKASNWKEILDQG